MSIEVTQEDVDRANNYLTSALRCTATLAEQFLTFVICFHTKDRKVFSKNGR